MGCRVLGLGLPQMPKPEACPLIPTYFSSVYFPFNVFVLASFILTILRGNPEGELQWRLQVLLIGLFKLASP